MSNGENENTNESEEKSTEKVENAQNAAKNALASFLQLKESNPKVFFGAIGGVVVLLLVIMMSGGSNKNLPTHQNTSISIGQNYVLKSANAADPNAPIRLVSIPGSMAAYDDTEEDDRTGCKTMTPGTPVSVVQTQDAFGKKDAFAQVEVTSGECQGYKGWVLAINIQ